MTKTSWVDPGMRERQMGGYRIGSRCHGCSCTPSVVKYRMRNFFARGFLIIFLAAHRLRFRARRVGSEIYPARRVWAHLSPKRKRGFLRTPSLALRAKNVSFRHAPSIYPARRAWAHLSPKRKRRFLRTPSLALRAKNVSFGHAPSINATHSEREAASGRRES